jgi:hypothetical protein
MRQNTIQDCDACGEHPYAFDLTNTDHHASPHVNKICVPCTSRYIEFLRLEEPESDLLPFLTEWVPDANVQL